MKGSYLLRRWLFTVGLSLAAAGVFAQTPAGTPAAKPFEPQVGQQGKDVVWVPTSQALVEKMLDLAKVTPMDYVIDLGSGDGRTVLTAARRGARAHGIEFNPDMVALSQKNAVQERLTARATFAKADLFESDFSKATVITMFLLPSINVKLRPKILDLAPGTRVVSNTFTMEDWQADETVTLDEKQCQSWCTALLWIVPAKVDGIWRLPQGELTLKQEYQMLTGTLRNGATTGPIADARMRGNQITFSAGGTQYTGQVTGNVMKGTSSRGTNTAWQATRASVAKPG